MQDGGAQGLTLGALSSQCPWWRWVVPVEQEPLIHSFANAFPLVQSSKPEDVGKPCQYFSLLCGLAYARKLKGTDKLHPKEVLVL